jgi:hypothetical protein
MRPIKRWLLKQYSDVKGNAKWAFLTLVWAMIIDASKSLLRLTPHIHDWEIWLLILAVSMAVFIYVVGKVPGPANQSSKPENQKANSPISSLREQVAQLGRDLFAFVREKGPEPEGPTPESGATIDDRMRWLVEVKSPLSLSILHGYKLRFEGRVMDMFHELREKGIAYEGVGELGSLGQVNSIAQVKAKAHACFNIVKEMDIAEEERNV